MFDFIRFNFTRGAAPFRKVSVLFYSVICLAPFLSASVAFEELFTNEAAANRSVVSYGWDVYLNGNAKKTSSGTALTNLPGSPERPAGHLYVKTGPKQYRALTKTLRRPVSLESGQSLIVFRMGSSLPTLQVRLLVQVDGAWYATSEIFTTEHKITSGKAFADANKRDTEKVFSFTTNARSWYAVTLEPEETLSLASSPLDHPLPAGSITGVGLYVYNPANTYGSSAYFDTLQIVE